MSKSLTITPAWHYNDAMDCPVCKEPMLAVEYEDIEIDCCPECQGIWLDEGELDLLFGDHALTVNFLTGGDPDAARGEQARPCPLCDAPMSKAVSAGPKPVVHDFCPQDHGLWFDGGELQTIIKHGAEDGQNAPVLRWLRKVFHDFS